MGYERISVMRHQGSKKGWKCFAADCLQTWTLCNLAIAIPIYGTITGNPGFLIAHKAGWKEVVFLLLMLVVFIPLLPIALQSTAKLVSNKAYEVLRVTFLVLLATITFLAALARQAMVPAAVLVVIAIGLGVVVIHYVERNTAARKFLLVLSVLPISLAIFFLADAGIRTLVFAQPSENIVPFGPIDASAPIVMVVFDELPTSSLVNEALEIDPDNYPNFATLAKNATWFRNATTVSDDTIAGAIPAIVTGQYPGRQSMASAKASPESIFTWLGVTYRLEVHETHTSLCPDSLCPTTIPLRNRLTLLLSDLSLVYLHVLLPDQYSRRLPTISQDWRHLWTTSPEQAFTQRAQDLGMAGRTHRFRNFLERIENRPSPTFYYLHILLPHVPWSHTRSGLPYDVRSGYWGMLGIEADEAWGSNPWPVWQGYHRHLMQLAYTDSLLGELIARMKSVGIYDDALIVVTADHGVSFRTNSFRRQLTPVNAIDIIPVPLIIKAPGQIYGEISDKNVETVDIVPTIAEILEVSVPWKTDGESAWVPGAKHRASKTVYRQNRRRNGDQVRFGPTILEALQAATVRRFTVLGNGKNPEKLAEILGLGSLIGTKVSDSGSADEPTLSKLKIWHAPPESGKSVLELDALPVSGLIYDPDASATRTHTLAYATNGIIRTVTQSVPISPEYSAFIAFLEPYPGSAADSEVSVYIIKNIGSELSLQRLTPVHLE